MERERQGEKAVYDNTRNVSPAITFRFFGTASCFLHRYCCCILFFCTHSHPPFPTSYGAVVLSSLEAKGEVHMNGRDSTRWMVNLLYSRKGRERERERVGFYAVFILWVFVFPKKPTDDKPFGIWGIPLSLHCPPPQSAFSHAVNAFPHLHFIPNNQSLFVRLVVFRFRFRFFQSLPPHLITPPPFHPPLSPTPSLSPLPSILPLMKSYSPLSLSTPPLHHLPFTPFAPSLPQPIYHPTACPLLPIPLSPISIPPKAASSTLGPICLPPPPNWKPHKIRAYAPSSPTPTPSINPPSSRRKTSAYHPLPSFHPFPLPPSPFPLPPSPFPLPPLSNISPPPPPAPKKTSHPPLQQPTIPFKYRTEAGNNIIYPPLSTSPVR